MEKNLKYIQGRYSLNHPEKYRGNPNQVFFRSLWEYHLFQWLDSSQYVLEWGSETVIIPYFNPIDKKYHRYFVDIYAKIKEKDGTIRKYLIEVKPYKETQKPKKATPQNMFKYIQNMSKWRYADMYAKNNDMKFIVLTERELYGKRY